jgi:hypothetical protein
MSDMGGGAMALGPPAGGDHAGHSGAVHLSFTCDGAAWMDMGVDKTGSWAGHVVAGVALLLWAFHWTWAVFKAWLTQSKQQPFRTRSSYPAPFLPAHWPVEGALKIAVSLVAILSQLWWAHGHFR